MSLATLRISVRRKLGIADSDATVTNPVTDEAINEANQSIATEKDWPWLYKEATGTLTAGTPLLASPADLTRIVFLNAQGRDLAARSIRDLSRFAVTPAGAANNGQPQAYTVAGANIRVAPYPAAGASYTYTLGYIAAEPVLVADGDLPLLPPIYQGWLVTRAALQIAIRTDNVHRIATLQAEDAEWRRRVQDNVRRSGGSVAIRRTKESVWQAV